VSICREWMLHRGNAHEAQAKLLLCRSWSCDYCAPLRKRALVAIALSGEPQRFLTLTVSPDKYSSPAERLQKLSWAWRTVVKRLRRKYGRDSVEYFVVVEETKKGEPHLHILLRGKFLPQKELSEAMSDLIGAPIVYIEKVSSNKKVARYVAKYVGKKPAQFGTSKRYWQSVGYSPHELYSDPTIPADFTKWEVFRHASNQWEGWISALGFQLTQCGPEMWTAHQIITRGKDDSS